MPIQFNVIQKDPELKKNMDDYLRRVKEDNSKALVEAFKRVREKNKTEKKKNSSKKLGSVAVSNTDTVTMCMKLKARLNAKLAEIYGSDLDPKLKNALARDVMVQMEKVETKISEIRRRERAVAEEKRAKKNEAEHIKRQRQRDIAKKTAYIRRDCLYPAEEGGLDPASYMPGAPSSDAAVSFDISGMTGTVSDAAAAILADVAAASVSAEAPVIDAEV